MVFEGYSDLEKRQTFVACMFLFSVFLIACFSTWFLWILTGILGLATGFLAWTLFSRKTERNALKDVYAELLSNKPKKKPQTRSK